MSILNNYIKYLKSLDTNKVEMLWVSDWSKKTYDHILIELQEALDNQEITIKEICFFYDIHHGHFREGLWTCLAILRSDEHDSYHYYQKMVDRDFYWSFNGCERSVKGYLTLYELILKNLYENVDKRY